MSKKDLDKAKKQPSETAEENVSEAAKAEEKDNKKAEKAPKKKKNLKKLKYGTMSAVVICLVTAIVVVVNLMTTLISKRYPIKLDFTPDKRFELSDETIDVLKNLNQDIELTVATEKDMFASMTAYYESMYRQYGINAEVPFDMIPQLLEKYSMYAEQGKGSIKVKYVNIEKDPDVLTKYNKFYNGEIESGSIIVYSNERVKVISGNDVMNMIKADQNSMQTGTPTFVFAGESTITSAIMNVVDAHPVKAAFIKTMNDSPLYSEEEYGQIVEGLKTDLLEKNGYDCTDVDIINDDLLADGYDIAVLAVPSADFTENVIQKLNDFLYNGGQYNKNLVYIPDVSATELKNIDAFLADWNIQVEPSLIADDKYATGSASNIYLCVDDADTVGALPNAAIPTVAPFARKLTILTKNNDNVVKSVLRSYDNSFLSDLYTGEADTDNREAHSVAVLSSREHAEQFNTFKSSVLVIGSPFMTSGELLTQTSTYNNANVLLGIFNNMTGKESGTVIPEKTLQQSYIAPSQPQTNAIKVVVIWVIPCVVAAAGIIVLLRRRNK